MIAAGQPPSRIRVNAVHFAPGARNAWHAHAVGQTVHVRPAACALTIQQTVIIAKEARP